METSVQIFIDAILTEDFLYLLQLLFLFPSLLEKVISKPYFWALKKGYENSPYHRHHGPGWILSG